VEFRELAPGDRASLKGGIAFTVPQGWEGFYTRYVDVPDWVPFSDARLHPPLHEKVDLRHTSALDDPANLLVAFTYARGDRPPGLPARVVSTDSPGVQVHASGEGTPTAAAIELERDGMAPAYLFISVSNGDVLGSVRRIWKLTRVEGAVAP
jgi:hypothetical protein